MYAAPFTVKLFWHEAERQNARDLMQCKKQSKASGFWGSSRSR